MSIGSREARIAGVSRSLYNSILRTEFQSQALHYFEVIQFQANLHRQRSKAIQSTHQWVSETNKECHAWNRLSFIHVSLGRRGDNFIEKAKDPFFE
jgi:hypothetical protein